MNLITPNAAAIDIGSTMHEAAVNPDTDIMPVRAFGTFTQDLHALRICTTLPTGSGRAVPPA
ncbi:hypothetical protein [Labrenzia sp. OB1]|uniref:hypothetical protein n=1 Tax=Labrenzia sp. OB1 TaxID=1561204 RepID=UPI001FCB6D5E|nr:hypothetical protein [Labrenzia sp. OB1]